MAAVSAPALVSDMRVLLVEDEPEMAELVAHHVRNAGWIVDRVCSIDEARVALRIGHYVIMLLDRRLPDGDGIGLLPHLREFQPGVPVIVLTALDDVNHKVRGLDAGADDYLTKPFDTAELLARIRAALRRPGSDPEQPIVCGRLRFETAMREVVIDGRPMTLKRRELAVLESLIRRCGRVVQRETLVNEVYGFDDNFESNTLDAHVSRLRARLAAAGAGVAIHPVRGVGYLLDEC